MAETYAKENGLKFVALDKEEQEQIDENQLDVMDDIMFPDGHDDDD